MRKISFLIALVTLWSWLGVSLHAQTTAGLQLWLKPEGLTNTAHASKISYGTNSAGPGHEATNGLPANQPTFLTGGLRGYPVARFLDDGSNLPNNTNLNWLVSPLPLSGNSNSFTAVIVIESQIIGTRDTEVLALVAKGYANKEVADALGLSAETVRSHLKTIYSKLHVRSRTQAAPKFRS